MRESDKIMAEKCEVCEQWFDSKKALRAHENDKHSQKFGSLSVAVMAMIFISLILFGCTQPTANFSLLTMSKKVSSESQCADSAKIDFMKACADAKLEKCTDIWNSTKVYYDPSTQDCTMQIPIETNEKVTRAV